MRRAWTGVVVSMLALAAACASGKAEQKPDKVTEATLSGNVEFVDSRSLMVSSAERPDQPAMLLSRGDQVSVKRGDQEVGWSELTAGDEVRVHYTERLSGPSEIDRVEILSGAGTGQKFPQDAPMPPESMPGEPGTPMPDEPTEPLPPTTPR